MPIREFICNKCSTKEERLLLGKEDNTIQSCNKCGANLMRLVSVSSFKFKKGGFSASSIDIAAGNNEKKGSVDLGKTADIVD